ncbi:MAG TPA: hypothetical protein VGH20_20060 [Myxococcales bacterium]
MGQKLTLGEALAKNAANAEKYVDKFCSEAEKLRAKPTMPPAGASADAAPFMAGRVDYEKPLDLPHGSLYLPEELRTRLRAADWISKVTDADLAGRDFSWMAALGKFDHWSLLGAGRLRDYADNDVLHGPIPNYSSLVGWAKLRYALALRQGDAAAASLEVRHLADLIRSQGILIGEMVAIHIYRFDVPARQAAAAAGQDVSRWIAPDLDDLQRQRELGFAALDFGYPGVDAATLRKAMSCAVAPCTALVEAVAVTKSLRGASVSDNLDVLNQLASERGCPADVLSRLNGTHEMATAEALEVVSDDLPVDLPKRLSAL